MMRLSVISLPLKPMYQPGDLLPQADWQAGVVPVIWTSSVPRAVHYGLR